MGIRVHILDKKYISDMPGDSYWWAVNTPNLPKYSENRTVAYLKCSSLRLRLKCVNKKSDILLQKELLLNTSTVFKLYTCWRRSMYSCLFCVRFWKKLYGFVVRATADLFWTLINRPTDGKPFWVCVPSERAFLRSGIFFQVQRLG